MRIVVTSAAILWSFCGAGLGSVVNASPPPESAQTICERMGGRVVQEKGSREEPPGRMVGYTFVNGNAYYCFDPDDPAYLARKATAQKVQDDAARKLQAEAKHQSEVEAAASAEQSCIESGHLSVCLALPKEAAKACLLHCIDGHDAVLRKTVEGEQEACESRFVGADGHGKFGCSFPGAIPNVDEAKIEADFEAAASAHDGTALDDVARRSDGQFFESSRATCTKTCNERGANLVAAPKQGPALVTSYKHCMVSSDSTREARKLDAYEQTLYCDYLHKADVRCRTTNRCDWLEGYSDLRCTYDSPGIGRCQ